MHDSDLSRLLDHMETTTAGLEPRLRKLERAVFDDRETGHEGLVTRLATTNKTVADHEDFLKAGRTIVGLGRFMGVTSAASLVSLILILIKLYGAP